MWKLLKNLFQKNSQINCFVSQPYGEFLIQKTGGANLVNGKQTWELAEVAKHDLDIMKQCCVNEIHMMELENLVPAPYYFNRVAILSKKQNDFAQLIEYSELYINSIDKFYKKNSHENICDVREGRTYKEIVKRLNKIKKEA